MSADEDIEYTEQLLTELEIAFGKGFLSPGGDEEVAKIVEGLDLTAKEVLNIGVGIGGPACLLVTNHNAKRVTGIDVENPVLERALATVRSYGIEDQIILKLVSPGLLPFQDESFDVVFSKDSIIHIPDKEQLFGEVFRVLKPGGWLAMSDWYCSSEPFTKEMSDWYQTTGLSFEMKPIGNDFSLPEEFGFVECEKVDRNAWFADFSQRLVDRLGGPDYDTMVSALGEAEAIEWLSRAKMRAFLSRQGQLRPGHIRGRKPN